MPPVPHLLRHGRRRATPRSSGRASAPHALSYRSGACSAIRSVRPSALARLSVPSSRAAASAKSRCRRSSARWNLPCGVTCDLTNACSHAAELPSAARMRRSLARPHPGYPAAMERTKVERPLVCQECGAVCDERAQEWEAHLGGGAVEGVDLGELVVGIYCPDCAWREFRDR
jgi:hypothetical protein